MSLWSELNEIYDKKGRQLYLIAYNILRSPQLAEDAVHDAFARLYSMNRTPERLQAYTFQAVRNAAIDFYRSNQKIRDHGGQQQIDNQIPGKPIAPGIYLENAEVAAQLNQAMGCLSTDEREVIILHLHAGLRFRQVADVMDRPMGTVVSWYHRGVEKLRKTMNPADFQ